MGSELMDRLRSFEGVAMEWYFLPFYAILRSITFDLGIPFTDITFIPAKLLGVIAMFASILLLFVFFIL